MQTSAPAAGQGNGGKPTNKESTMTNDTEWVEVPAEFGTLLPNGSCNAWTSASGVCGYPRRSDGTCLNGHPAPPGWPSGERPAFSFQGGTRDSEPPAKPGDTWVLKGHPMLRMNEDREWVAVPWPHEASQT